MDFKKLELTEGLDVKVLMFGVLRGGLRSNLHMADDHTHQGPCRTERPGILYNKERPGVL